MEHLWAVAFWIGLFTFLSLGLYRCDSKLFKSDPILDGCNSLMHRLPEKARSIEAIERCIKARTEVDNAN